MSISIGDMTGLSSPEQLFSWLLDQSDPEHGLESIKHRRQVVQAWNIALGSRILEIGSGQGDFTVVLADAVGPTGHVTAIDPSPVDWGEPYINTVYSSADPHVLRNAYNQ